MSTEDELSPREFLKQVRFSPERADKRFRNARRHILNGIFISHSGLDYHQILDDIVLPVMSNLMNADGQFLHSRLSGGAEGYRQLVQAALHWCDKFMVVISERSIMNDWVLAEVEWAIENGRPILAVRLDRFDWPDVIQRLGIRPESFPAVPTFDFSHELQEAQSELGKAIEALLVKFPHRPRVSGNG